MSEVQDQPIARLGQDGASFSLRSTGFTDDAYPGGAFGAVLSLDGGEIRLERRCSIWNVEHFCRQLATIHETLRGTAELSTLDDLSISISVDDLGHLQVGVKAGQVGAIGYVLKLSFVLDQTFLPPFIRSLRAAFPSKVAP